jgi:lipopolysaccharide exporter
MKINLKSYWLKSGFFSLLDRGTIQVFRFLSFFVMVRGLSKADFGIWSLYLTLAAVVEMIRVGLIQNALVRFLSIYPTPQEQGEVGSSALALSLLHSCLSAFLLTGMGWVVGQFWELSPLDDLLAIYIVTTFVLTIYYHFLSVQQAHLKFQGTFWANLARHSSFFVYVLWIYLSPDRAYDLVQLVWVQLGTIGFSAVVAVAMGWRYARFSLRVHLSRMREIIQYGKFVVGTNLSTTSIKTVDQVMLGVLVSPIGVASYSTAMRIAHLVEVPIQSIAAVVFPQSARQMKDQGQEAICRLYERSVGVILAMVVPGVCFVLLFTDQVLHFVAGPDYLDAVPVLQVVMLYALMLPFSRQFGTIMESIGKPSYQFGLLAIGAAINLGLNYFLIQWQGVMGAAYASISTYFLIVVGSLIILRREVGVQLAPTLGFAIQLYRNGFQMLWRRVEKMKEVRD